MSSLKRAAAWLRADYYDVGYLLLVVVAATFDLKDGSGAITSARLSAGALLLLNGLAIRYILSSERWRSRRLFVIPWRYARILTSLKRDLRPREPDYVYAGEHIRLPDDLLWRVEQALPVRNAMRYGLVLTAGGICLALGSPVSAVAAIPAGLIGLTWAQDRQERSLLDRWANEPQSHAARSLLIERVRRRAVIAPLSTNVVLAMATFVVFAAVALLTREWAFASLRNDGDAQSLLLAVAGVQGTWGVLALSAWLIVVQLVSANYAPRLVRRVLFHRPIVFALLLVAASASFDVVVVARAQDWLVQHPSRGAIVIDEALLAAAIALVVLIIASVSAFSVLAPARLAAAALRQFDRTWLQWVKQSWPQHFVQTVSYDEPSQDCEEFLRMAVLRGDIETAQTTIVEFRMRLSTLDAATHWPAVDAYLDDKMGELIKLSSSKFERLASAWISLAAELGGSWLDAESLEAIQRGDRFDRSPPGERVLMRATICSISAGHEDAVTSGIRALSEHIKATLPFLPQDDETEDFHPDPDHWRQVPKDELERLHRNQDAITLVADRLVPALEGLFEEGIRSKSEWSVGFSAAVTAGLISDLAEKLSAQPRIRTYLVRTTLSHIATMATLAAASGLASGALPEFDVHYALYELDTDSDEDRALFRDIVAGGLEVCRVYLAANGYHRSVADGPRMMGLEAAKKDDESAREIVNFLVGILNVAVDDLGASELAQNAKGALRQMYGYATAPVRQQISQALGD